MPFPLPAPAPHSQMELSSAADPELLQLMLEEREDRRLQDKQLRRATYLRKQTQRNLVPAASSSVFDGDELELDQLLQWSKEAAHNRRIALSRTLASLPHLSSTDDVDDGKVLDGDPERADGDDGESADARGVLDLRHGSIVDKEVNYSAKYEDALRRFAAKCPEHLMNLKASVEKMQARGQQGTRVEVKKDRGKDADVQISRLEGGVERLAAQWIKKFRASGFVDQHRVKILEQVHDAVEKGLISPKHQPQKAPKLPPALKKRAKRKDRPSGDEKALQAAKKQAKSKENEPVLEQQLNHPKMPEMPDMTMPVFSDDFPPVPPSMALNQREMPDSAFQQPAYSFRRICEAVHMARNATSETSPGEQEHKNFSSPNDLSDKSIPSFFAGRLQMVPRELKDIPLDPFCDGFDTVPTEFVRSIWDGKCDYARLLKESSVFVERVQGKAPSETIEPIKLQKSLAGKEKAQKRLWAAIIKRDAIKEAKKFNNRMSMTLSNLKKISQNVVRETKRRSIRTLRASKECQTRAKRLVREMLSYWRKSEKELNERKKSAEKDLQEQRKREEEAREETRQQRKLEFLLSQTELFSHFIGNKMGIASSQISGPIKSSSSKFSEDHLAEIRAEAAESTKALILQQRAQTQDFDKKYKSLTGEVEANLEDGSHALDDVDLLHPSTMPEQNLVTEPSIFKGKLKSYQLKGLNWLANLYDQGINGILADEMGLGKTIQTICFIGYLAEVQNIWGPFLIVAPNSTLLQWVSEINRFCPDLKVIPYWGDQASRKVIRRFWNPKEIYKKDGHFHVCVTSYAMFVSDEKYFQKLHWQYLILDEAQAIKNSGSMRWRSLLNIRCRNRLLLTGTPIQNSMAELWALLHFIMPQLFDSHDEFNEWFSKDIENHASGMTSKLDHHQIQRLHVILKPFMLRRVKSDVEHEMAPKIEIQYNCQLSMRQKLMYNALKEKLSLSDLEDPALNSKENLLNLVMQFRKVCNHPEIFDRRFASSPFVFTKLAYFRDTHPGIKRPLDFVYDVSPGSFNPIEFHVPLLFEIEFPHSFNYEAHSLSQKLTLWHQNTLKSSSWMSALARMSGLSLSEAVFLYWAQLNPLLLWIGIVSLETQRRRRFESNFASLGVLIPGVSSTSRWSLCSPLVKSNEEHLVEHIRLIKSTRVYHPAALAPPIRMHVSGNRRFEMKMEALFDAGWDKSVILGRDYRPCTLRSTHQPVYAPGVAMPASMDMITPKAFAPWYFNPDFVLPPLLEDSTRVWCWNSSMIMVPGFGKLLSDSGKLLALDNLLTELKAGGHRVLIFSQMRKMIDILEDYMHRRGHKMYRLDGNTDVFERRAMVNAFQNSDETFAFLLSTRAGGLGITLTAADTVIFYDNDWNPTMDAQAMDRVHRIGQTKQVRVYRLVCKNTIEERILRRAQEKFVIQNTVYSGGFKMQSAVQDSDVFKSNELKDLLLEE